MMYLLNFKELHGQRKLSLAKKIKAYDFLTPKAINTQVTELTSTGSGLLNCRNLQKGKPPQCPFQE